MRTAQNPTFFSGNPHANRGKPGDTRRQRHCHQQGTEEMGKLGGIFANSQTPEKLRSNRDAGRGEGRKTTNAQGPQERHTTEAETKAEDGGAKAMRYKEVAPEDEPTLQNTTQERQQLHAPLTADQHCTTPAASAYVHMKPTKSTLNPLTRSI